MEYGLNFDIYYPVEAYSPLFLLRGRSNDFFLFLFVFFKVKVRAFFMNLLPEHLKWRIITPTNERWDSLPRGTCSARFPDISLVTRRKRRKLCGHARETHGCSDKSLTFVRIDDSGDWYNLYRTRAIQPILLLLYQVLSIFIKHYRIIIASMVLEFSVDETDPLLRPL